MKPAVLIAGDFDDRESGRGDADVDQRLDLETVAPQAPVTFRRSA